MATLKSCALVLVAIGTLASPALASTSEARTRNVTYADLDLSRDGGKETFRRRIDQAIIAVCGQKLAGDAVRNRAVSQCRAETRAALAPRVARAIDARAPRFTAIEVTAASD